MSRVVTPQTPRQASPATTTTTPFNIPHEKIAMRAYEKWCKRGRPQGTHVQDWLEAETELKAEYAKSGGSPPPRR
jgi:hypothetical protein